MLALAFQQMLKTAGLAPVLVGGFGDYDAAGAPQWAVHAEAGALADHGGDSGLYPARLQVRTRAANAIDAEAAGRQAYDLVLAANRTVLVATDPRDASERRYEVSGIRAVQRPTWYPTPEPGEETSCNFVLSVRDV